MADEARELLKRLVEWFDNTDAATRNADRVFEDTRAFLAREQDGPVAEFRAEVWCEDDGSWRVEQVAEGGELIAFPIPRRLIEAHETPIVGSVVENQEGK